jgi:hypothetical protein
MIPYSLPQTQSPSRQRGLRRAEIVAAVAQWALTSASLCAIMCCLCLNQFSFLRRAEIVAASVDGSVRCFDLRAGCVTTDELRRPVTSLALSRDGNCLLAACLDSRLRLLDRGSGTLLAQYTSAPRAWQRALSSEVGFCISCHHARSGRAAAARPAAEHCAGARARRGVPAAALMPCVCAQPGVPGHHASC